MLIGTLVFGLFILVATAVLLVLWAITKKKIFGIIVTVLWLWFIFSGNNTYGTFWDEFHHDQIISKVESAELNHLIIGWKSEQENTFNMTEIVNYASQNKWILRDSLIMPFDTLRVRLDSYGTDILNYKEDYSLILLRNKILSHLDPELDYRIYIFETDGYVEMPGPVYTTKRNGFVVLNSLGKQLRVFHFWEEVM